MKLAFQSDLLLPPISKALSFLTDKAKVCINDIHYDEANGVVDIYLHRRELIGFKENLLRGTQPTYGQTTIKSLLTIRKVDGIKIEVDDRLVEECNSCFTVLFGLKIDGNRLYLGSVEEMQGRNLCQIFIKVQEINIEYSDELKM